MWLGVDRILCENCDKEKINPCKNWIDISEVTFLKQLTCDTVCHMTANILTLFQFSL